MREISIIKQNILKYLDFKGISKYEFYQKTGVSNGILSQKNGLSEENTLRFLSYYKDCSTDWLFLGLGEMIKPNIKEMPPFETVAKTVAFSVDTKNTKNATVLKNDLPPLLDIVESGNANVIILPVKSAASDFTRSLTDPIFLEGNYETMSLPKLQHRKGPFFAVEIEGDSLHPTITHGEYLVGSPVIANEFTGGYIHTLFHVELGLISKRVHWSSKEDGILLLCSDNESIDDVEVRIEDVSPYFLKAICSVNFNLRNWNSDVRKDIRDIKKQLTQLSMRIGSKN